MVPRVIGLLGTALVCLACVHAAADSAPRAPDEDRRFFHEYFRARFPDKPLSEYIYGSLMLNADARAQYESIMEFPPFQGDIDRGRALWEKPFSNGTRFADCFADGGRGAAARYPRYDPAGDEVVTFEMAINRCREANGETPYAFDDVRTMGALTAYARLLSDGATMRVEIDSAGARAKYQAGREFFFRRIGQMNLACASCHVTHAGQYFRDEIISPALGQPNHFPVFRGGEFLFTLHMRYQRCMEALRAEPFAAGSEELNNLEFFHSYISNGLPLKASVYRR